ncbi:MAG: L-seryl-tRNA(Sec) selenium transferase [Bryobacterales bacterium]|nr:L-seryl-tRNA(Sec) selenium transferase [Bryobacterales bacterium]
MSDRRRQLPSVDAIARQIEGYPHALVVAETRRLLASWRKSDTVPEDAVAAVRDALAELKRPSLRNVINATGVVLHTNLGRAPLASVEALDAYSNLEYDLSSGKRGKRDVHLSALLDRLLGVPAIAVNNNAAAVYLVLNELAAGQEVIVSRGQLIEIGDGFRIPDIMQRAGVVLKEVGATNRTHLADYETSITERTRLLLIVHPSNFRIQGFCGQPSREEIVALGRKRGIPVYEDLGSGCLVDLKPYDIDEPLVQDCVGAGMDLVSFSGDKLMGGPQAGIIAGRPDLVTRLRRNPMFRALRLDKLILQQLEATLRAVLFEDWEQLPALRMIRQTAAEIQARATAMAAQIPNASIAPGQSVMGGGSTPEQTLPTSLVLLEGPAVTLQKKLRSYNPPVIARIEDNRVVLDLRTVLPSQEATVIAAVRASTCEPAAPSPA